MRRLGAKGVLLVCACAALASACGPPRTESTRPRLVPPVETLDFGAVPVLNEKLQDVPVLNVGRATLDVLSARVEEEGTPFTIKSSPDVVESGDTQPIAVAFVPPAEADYQATLVLETEDEENPVVRVKLSGKGSTRAIMEIEPTELDFGRVGECGAAVRSFTIRSKGTADLIIEEIAFAEGSSDAFSFVGSTKTPVTVPAVGANGLPGEIQLTVKYAVPAGTSAPAEATIRIRGTDPENREVLIPVRGAPNLAPVPVIAPLGNGAPGLEVTLDGSGSTDPDGDLPLGYRWTLRRKPLGSSTVIASPDQAVTKMVLDPAVPGEYEVELGLTDATGAKSCQPARAKIVASPAQKLLVEMFWNHAKTDIDLHVMRNINAPLGSAPDDCFYGNPKPDWGAMGDSTDDPEFLRDALTGYGPEVVGYVNPVDGNYRLVVEFTNDHLDPHPESEVTLRIYEFGVVKGEFKRRLEKAGDIWVVADLEWPSGVITPLQ